MKKAVISFYLFTALCFVSLQTAAAQITDEQIAAKAEEYLSAAVKFDHFSGSVLVARDGKPIFSRGYGMANYELKMPNSPRTAFRLGSITKQFTSAAIMQLQERGKLSITDSICKYLENCPAAWQPITIRHLMTHTSGIPNYTSFPGFFEKNSVQPYTFAGFVDEFRSKPLEFTPGEKFAYSNSGYYLLGLIIEKASGATYAHFLRENIFTPLMMNNSGYDDTRSLVPNRASGYIWSDKSFVNAPYLNMVIPYAAGALYSTTEDLLRWEQSLNTEKILKKKSLDEIFTPFKENYGYGWGINKLGEHKLISHGGGINGFATNIMRFPDDRLTVIVLSNNEEAKSGAIARNLAAIVFGMPYKIPEEIKSVEIAADTLKKYAGEYQLAPNFVITVTVEDGKLMAQATGQPKFQLFAKSESEFFLTVVDAQVTFVKNDKGEVTSLVLHQGGRDTPGQKIK